MPIDVDQLLPAGGALTSRIFSRLIATSTPSDAPLPPGTLVGYWRVREPLGRGGSSIVYLADRADGQFEQQAALKIVHDSPGLMEHFRRERQILAELHHPAIVQLIDGGQLPGGRLWFAMEPVIGQRIDRYVRERRMPLDDRLALFDAVCEAVAYAHSRLLIHRDIKPGNLIVDESGRPRLLDFGIATSGEGGVGAAAMTPTYASPEQRTGGAVTTASDIYQLGLLLGALALPAGQPCETLPQRVRRVVERELRAIVARATEGDPAARYPTVAALRSDIASVRARRAVSVIHGFGYHLARFLERNAVSSTVAAAAMLTLLVTGIFFAYGIKVERDQARAAATRARATRDFLVGLFTVADPAENRGELLTANQILARGASQLRKDATSDPAQVAAVGLEIGRVYMEMGEYRRAKDTLDFAIGVAEARLRQGARERIALRTLDARVNYFRSDYESAARDLANARHEFEIGPPIDPDNSEGAIATGEALLARRLGRVEEALTLQTNALAHLERAGNPDYREIGFAYNNLGLIHHDRGDYAAAIHAYERSLAAYREHFGNDDVRALGPSVNLAEVLLLEGQTERAERLFVETISQLRSLQQVRPSTNLLHAMGSLSLIRLAQGRYAEALRLAQESDDGLAQSLGPEHNYRGYSLIELGRAKLALGTIPAALGDFEEALRLRHSAFDWYHPDTAEALHYVALAHAKLGAFAAAETELERVIELRASVSPGRQVELARTRLDRAEILFALDRGDDALREVGLARDLLKRHEGVETAELERADELGRRIESANRQRAVRS